MEYKITFKNQFKCLEHLIYGSIMMSLAIYYVIKTDGYTEGIPVVFGTIYLINFIPTLYIHIEYFLKNKNDILIIDTIEKTIRINEQKPIFFIEIEKITYVMPPVWHRKGFVRILPYEDYHYAKIRMKSGEQFIFTSLMAYRVEDVLKQISGVMIEKRKLLFATTLI